MAKPINPNLQIPKGFAIEGQKTDFLDEQIQNGFDPVDPDVLAGDNLNKLIDDTYKGLNYTMDGVSDLYKGAVLYDETETYSNKSIVFNIDENGEAAIYQSLINDNSGNALTDTTKWQKVELGSTIDLDKINQSKALETGNVSSDADVYADIQKYAHSTFDKSKFEVVGSPVITEDGVLLLDGISNRSNYVRSTISEIDTTKPFKLYLPFKGIAQGTSPAMIYLLNESIQVNYDPSGDIKCFLRTGKSGTYWDIINNLTITPASIVSAKKDILLVIEFTGSRYIFGYIVDGTYIEQAHEDTTTTVYNSNLFYIGWNANNAPAFTGSIDLKQFSITVDGKEVFSGNQTGLDIIKPDEYTVTGTPSISETGITSNLGNGNKIQCNTFTLADLKNKSWKAECVINVVDLNTSDTADISTYLLKFCDGWHTYGGITCVYYNEINRFNFRLHTRVDDIEGWYCSTTIPVLTEEIKRLKIIATFDKDAETQNYKLKVFNADTGEQLGSTGSYTPATDKKELDIIDDLPTQSPLLGESGATTNWTTYDLNTYKFYIEDKLVWQPCLKIPYTLSKTGSKIVDATYRDRVQDVYEQYGVAMYYTIDEENENFTLPMGEIYGMISKNEEILDVIYPIGRPMQEINNELLENEVWLEGATVSRTDYANLFNVYGTTYGEGDGSTTFQLPDLRDRVLWGSPDASKGYIEPGLPNITGGVKVGGIGSQPIALQNATGAFTLTESGRYMTRAENGGNAPSRFELNASLSSSVYSDDVTTVQPPAFKVRWKTRFE